MAEAFADFHDPEILVLRYHENPTSDLKDMILAEYSGLVERTARRFAGLESLEDLVQVGFIGLLNALGKFDPAAGVKFNTYATHLVAGEIKHYLRDRTHTIRHPAWLQELRHKVQKAASALQASLSRPPTEAEIAETLGITESSVREVYQTQEMLKIASLDTPPQADEDGGEVDNLDAADFCPEQLSVEDRVVLEEAMSRLRDLEREVLVRFHFEAMNQTEIAAELGISCNYVSHILRQSLSKLRRILVNEDEKDRILRRQVPTASDDVVDGSTGLYNEEYFMCRLMEEVHRASSTNGVMATLIIEFDGLHGLQGFFGESSVDDFIADAAQFLKDSVRRLDVTCRRSKNGIAVVMPTTGSNITTAAERIRVKLDSWLLARNTPSGPITAKVGHASFPEDGQTARALMESATLAMMTSSQNWNIGSENSIRKAA